MITQQLIDFIKEQLGQGKTGENTKQTLLLQGWKEEDINQAFRDINGPKLSQINNIIKKINMGENFIGPTLPRLAGLKLLIKSTWNIVKNNFWKFWLVSAVYLVIIGLISWGAGQLFNGRVSFSGWLDWVIMSVFALLLLWIASMFVVTLTIISGHNDRHQSLGSTFGEGVAKGIPTFGMVLSYSLITISSMALPLIGVIIGMNTGLELNGFLNLVGILMCIGLIFSAIILVWVTFALYIFIFEKENWFNSLFKSKAYVKQYWWAVFGRTCFISIVFQIIVSILQKILAYCNLSENWQSLILLAAFFLVFYPLMLCYSYSLWKTIKTAKRNLFFKTKKKEKIIAIILIAVGIATIIIFWMFSVKISEHFTNLTQEYFIEKLFGPQIIQSDTISSGSDVTLPTE